MQSQRTPPHTHLILEPEVRRRRHMQARRQHRELDGEDGQLSLLRLAGVALNADDVAALGLVVQRLEGGQVELGLAVRGRGSGASLHTCPYRV